MPHQRLLLKLKAHGIGNGMINWIENWLIDRRQRVVVDGEIITLPVLFLIYINDLLKFVDDN